MMSLLDNPTVLHATFEEALVSRAISTLESENLHNHVRMLGKVREAMGHKNSGFSPALFLESLEYVTFRNRIQSRSRFVDH